MRPVPTFKKRHTGSGIRTPGRAVQDARRSSKSGQTLLFMALVIVMIAFATLFYFDVNKTLHVKGKARNAGDAAALVGARWQGITLNLIGNLNVAEAVAMADALAIGEFESEEAELIALLQDDLRESGPMFGFLAAQTVAKNNGIYNNDYFASYLGSFANTMEWRNPQSAEMLRTIAGDGTPVMAEGAIPYPFVHNRHTLLQQDFYRAVASRNWCWFYFNEPSLLTSYTSWQSWPDLPDRESPSDNSIIFNLRLSWTPILGLIPILPSDLPGDSWAALLENYTSESLPEAVAYFGYAFSTYDTDYWTEWMPQISANFPWESDVRSEYDYFGADAAIRIATENSRHSNFRVNSDATWTATAVNWTSAAKPFGTLFNGERPNEYDLVLPAYSEVRLIPLDASSTRGVDYDLEWLAFVTIDSSGNGMIDDYMENGPSVLPSNFYANALRLWEDPAFRQEGAEWLAEYSGSCVQPSPGGGPGGGTSHGH